MPSTDDLLRDRVFTGYERLRERRTEDFLGFKDDEDYRKRIDFELGVFADVSARNRAALGYGSWADFLLVTADYANAARARGVFIGGGRGSAAASLVCLSLGITTGIDPLRFGLIFERFLNPGRVSAPDIDLDFSDQEVVFDYLTEKYGVNRVVRICAPQYLKPKSAVEKAGEALGMERSDTITISKAWDKVEKDGALHDYKDVDPAIFDAALVASEELRGFQGRYPKLFPLAKRFLGLLSGHSTHPAGALICADPAGSVIPLMRVGSGKEAAIRTAWSKDELERQGWVKCDVLSVTNLRIILAALALVKERHGIDLVPEDIPLRDAQTSALFSSGDIVGIFQLGDNQIAHRLCVELPAETVDDVALINALIRPGIEWSKTVQNKRHPQDVYYPIDSLREILRDSYGVFTYQEQIMWACLKLAGFSMVEADTIRKIVATTSNEALRYNIEDHRQEFIDGCVFKGHTIQQAAIVWESLRALATYCFNKAHAVSYGVISWQEGYIKSRWPAEYLCACLNDVIEKGSQWRDRYERFVADAKRHGIKVLPPDVNHSQGLCHVDAKGRIVLGLRMVKNVGKQGDKAHRNAPYKDYRDFVLRSGMAAQDTVHSVKRSLRGELFGDDGLILGGEGCIDDVTESLIVAGAFDSMHPREDILSELHPTVEITAALTAAWEEEVVGFFVSTNPLLDLAGDMRGWVQTDEDPRQRGTGGGLVMDVFTSRNYHGFLTVKTLKGTMELVCWADEWKQYRLSVQKGSIIRGRLYKTKRGNYSISEIEVFEEQGAEQPA